MRVLLIYPPISEKEVYAKYAEAAPCLPPLGLLYLARYLLDAKYEVKIIDCVAERLKIEELEKQITGYSPTIVGVSSTTVAFHYAKHVLNLVKKVNPQITTVLGGPHLSACKKEAMEECCSIDIGVMGEGEHTLLEMVRKIDNHNSYTDIKGIIYRKNGDIIQNESYPFIKDMDKIPFPARELIFNLSSYSHTALRGKGKKFATTMISSRGCPYKCSFCDQSIFGSTWRMHSAEYVFSEMKYLKEKFGVEFISFEDDNFMLAKKRIRELCQKIINQQLDIKWACSGRVNNIDDEILMIMKKAGCESIYIGIESGSPRIIKLLNKNISQQTVNDAVKKIRKYGIRVVGSFIIGTPSETRQEMRQTIKYAMSLPLDGASFFIFSPYPGTKLREMAFEYGTVSTNWKDYTGHPSCLPFIPKGFTQEELLALQEMAYKRFLLRPSYIWRYLRSHSMGDLFQKGIIFLKAFYFDKKISKRYTI